MLLFESCSDTIRGLWWVMVNDKASLNVVGIKVVFMVYALVSDSLVREPGINFFKKKSPAKFATGKKPNQPKPTHVHQPRPPHLARVY
jgi:hypothetical protein